MGLHHDHRMDTRVQAEGALLYVYRRFILCLAKVSPPKWWICRESNSDSRVAGATARPRTYPLIFSILLLSGCATQEHYIATSCVKDVPTRPQIHSNADLIAASPADRYKGIAADMFRLIDENNQLWALIEACR